MREHEEAGLAAFTRFEQARTQAGLPRRELLPRWWSVVAEVEEAPTVRALLLRGDVRDGWMMAPSVVAWLQRSTEWTGVHGRRPDDWLDEPVLEAELALADGSTEQWRSEGAAIRKIRIVEHSRTVPGARPVLVQLVRRISTEAPLEEARYALAHAPREENGRAVLRPLVARFLGWKED